MSPGCEPGSERLGLFHLPFAFSTRAETMIVAVDRDSFTKLTGGSSVAILAALFLRWRRRNSSTSSIYPSDPGHGGVQIFLPLPRTSYRTHGGAREPRSFGL